MARYTQGRTTWVLIIICILLGLSVVSWLWFDEAVVQWVSRQDRSWYDRPLAGAYVQLGKGWVLVWLVALAAFYRGLRPGPVGVLIALAVAGILVGPLKPLVGRIRPEPAIAIQEGRAITLSPSARHSFPSGDAAAAFAAAVTLAYMVNRQWKVFALLVGASAIAALRVLSLNHYPSDVLVGAGIGVFAGMLGARIVVGWYMSSPGGSSWTVRVTSGSAAAIILVASILAQKSSSILLFLAYFGPVIGIWMIWDLRQRYRSGKFMRGH